MCLTVDPIYKTKKILFGLLSKKYISTCPEDYEKVASRNIPIKKILIRYRSKLYYTPYTRTIISKSGELCAQGIKDIIGIDSINNHVEIGEGYIHSFNYYCDGKFSIIYDDIKSHLQEGEEILVISGYIPKGTKYIMGRYKEEVCSEKIILNLPSGE